MDPTAEHAATVLATGHAAYITAVIALISLVVQTTGALGLAWIGYKMAKLEKNTNSIKDALVAETRTSSHALGVKEERERASMTQLD